tara:strand:+ start:115 stop:861 length:747 start_codon:yes stop_codon:yes gene_type:complete
MKNFNFAIILTSTINPGDMPNVVRNDIKTRLNDYKKSFNFWINQKSVNKIIFIENSGFDLTFFRTLAKSNQHKEIEIISTNSNNSFDKKKGKGYGHYLCLKEVFNSSEISKKTNFFIDITGRHCINNFNSILKDIMSNNTDIYNNLSDSLKYSEASIYGGSKKFFLDYVLPELEKTSDIEYSLFENRIASATLKAVSNGMSLSKIPLYPEIDGYIGTNGKKFNQNIFKKIKLFFFRKMKNYFFKHKKY